MVNHANTRPRLAEMLLRVVMAGLFLSKCDIGLSSLISTSKIYRGPGFRISDFESNRIIGENQFLGAKKLMDGNSLASIKGAVRSLHTYVNMCVICVACDLPRGLISWITSRSSYSFPLANGTTVHTCPPAMGRYYMRFDFLLVLTYIGLGYSFAGGTSDGPGAFDFTQGETADGTQYVSSRILTSAPTDGFSRNPFWEVVKGTCIYPRYLKF